MATELRVCCDRCHAVVLEQRTLLKVESGPIRVRHQSIDLCLDCQSAFAGFLKEFSDEATVSALPFQESPA